MPQGDEKEEEKKKKKRAMMIGWRPPRGCQLAQRDAAVKLISRSFRDSICRNLEFGRCS